MLIPDVQGLFRLGFELFHAAKTDALLMKHNAAAGQDGGVIGHLASGGEVLVQGLGAYEQHVAGVGKTFTTAAVGLELLGQPVVAPGQIADGVVVLGIREPPHGYRAWIACLRIGQGIQ